VSTTYAPTDAVRCSRWAREAGLQPIGTAGSYRGFLLVETPLPWPRDVGEIGSLAAIGSRPGWRLQALVPASLDAPAAQRRVILHRRADGDDWFAGYSRISAEHGASLPDAVSSLAGASGSEPDIDLLVCTHGRRDVCCGSLGTDLALQLAARDATAGVRFWRTSHTGGHRFAATFMVLPQGTGWAFAGVELVDQVLARSVPFAQIADHYRGCAGLAGPQVQVMEREALIRENWELLDTRRRGFATGETTSDGGRVYRLEADSSAWEAVIRPGRTMPTPDCMKPLSEAKKSETEWNVSDFRSVS
jgi:hypothetical protein